MPADDKNKEMLNSVQQSDNDTGLTANNFQDSIDRFSVGGCFVQSCVKSRKSTCARMNINICCSTVRFSFEYVM